MFPILSAKNIYKTYQKKNSPPIEVLKNISLPIANADTIAILGKSGSGKSTLLQILGALDTPTTGKVFFLEEDLSRLNEEKKAAFRNKELGFVFQFHYLMLEFTALENVMMPALLGNISANKAKERAKMLLSRVGLIKRLDHKPSQLSGGEQQRVAIARALMMNPKVLLTDEMTGNLDDQTSRIVFSLLMEIQSEYRLAIVSVTHDERLASAYNKIFRLENGSLISIK